MSPKKIVTNTVAQIDTDSRLPQKVAAILQGAMQEFLTHGFAGTTMDRVTAAAGVSKATVYNYFQDKEKLFFALIDRSISSHRSKLDRLNSEFFQREPTVVLTDLANNFLNQVSDTPELLDLIRLTIAESKRFPMLAHHLILDTDRQFVGVVTQYLRSRPDLQLADPDATTRIFLGTLVHYAIVEYMLQAGAILPMERQKLINCLVDLITCKQIINEDKYAAIKAKSSRRKRASSGRFERDYTEPKHLRSIRLTDTAWDNLEAIATSNNLTRTEAIELLARGVQFVGGASALRNRSPNAEI
jgi:AcrR family transcriptional regulator